MLSLRLGERTGLDFQANPSQTPDNLSAALPRGLPETEANETKALALCESELIRTASLPPEPCKVLPQKAIIIAVM